jgi:N12 class adenine-specific DNA methylase
VPLKTPTDPPEIRPEIAALLAELDGDTATATPATDPPKKAGQSPPPGVRPEIQALLDEVGSPGILERVGVSFRDRGVVAGQRQAEARERGQAARSTAAERAARWRENVQPQAAPTQERATGLGVNAVPRREPTQPAPADPQQQQQQHRDIAAERFPQGRARQYDPKAVERLGSKNESAAVQRLGQITGIPSLDGILRGQPPAPEPGEPPAYHAERSAARAGILPGKPRPVAGEMTARVPDGPAGFERPEHAQDVRSPEGIARQMSLAAAERERIVEMEAHKATLAWWEKARHSAAAVGVGLVEMPAGMLDGMSVLFKTIDLALQRTGEGPAGEYLTGQLAQGLRDFSKQVLPYDEKLQEDFFWSMVPAAFGSFAAFYATAGMAGGVSRAAGLSKGAAQAAQTGTAMAAAGTGGMGQMYREAQEYGASENVALAAGWGGLPFGIVQVAPVVRLLNRVNKVKDAGGHIGLRAIAGNTAETAFEEGLLEGAGQAGYNLVARWAFDPERSLMKGVVEASAAGAIAGGGMGAATMGGMAALQRLRSEMTDEQYNAALGAIRREGSNIRRAIHAIGNTPEVPATPGMPGRPGGEAAVEAALMAQAEVVNAIATIRLMESQAGTASPEMQQAMGEAVGILIEMLEATADLYGQTTREAARPETVTSLKPGAAREAARRAVPEGTEDAADTPTDTPSQAQQTPTQHQPGAIEHGADLAAPDAEFQTIQLNKPLGEMSDEEVAQIRTHLRGKLSQMEMLDPDTLITATVADVEGDLENIDAEIARRRDLKAQEALSDPDLTRPMTAEEMQRARDAKRAGQRVWGITPPVAPPGVESSAPMPESGADETADDSSGRDPAVGPVRGGRTADGREEGDRPRRNFIGSDALEDALSEPARAELAKWYKSATKARDLRHIRAAMEVYQRLLAGELPGYTFGQSPEHEQLSAELLRAVDTFFQDQSAENSIAVDEAIDAGLSFITGEAEPDWHAELMEDQPVPTAAEVGELIFSTLDPATASFDVEEFNTAYGGIEFSREPADVFPAPTERQVARARGPELLTQEAAAERLAEWKAKARAEGDTGKNRNRVVYSLFDRSGVISQPWVDAGFTVRRFDITSGQDLMRFGEWMAQVEEDLAEGMEVVGVLAQPPCTSFAVSGARWWDSQHDKPSSEMVAKKYGLWATKYFDTPLDYANTLVAVVKLFVAQSNPKFYVMENPVGRIASENGLPKSALVFDPSSYGDPYTKQTHLWGEFNPDLPQAPVEPTEGSLVHKLRGDIAEEKAQRSVTPEGFAYAFFMANYDGFGEAAAAAPAGAGVADSLTQQLNEAVRGSAFVFESVTEESAAAEAAQKAAVDEFFDSNFPPVHIDEDYLREAVDAIWEDGLTRKAFQAAGRGDERNISDLGEFLNSVYTTLTRGIGVLGFSTKALGGPDTLAEALRARRSGDESARDALNLLWYVLEGFGLDLTRSELERVAVGALPAPAPAAPAAPAPLATAENPMQMSNGRSAYKEGDVWHVSPAAGKPFIAVTNDPASAAFPLRKVMEEELARQNARKPMVVIGGEVSDGSKTKQQLEAEGFGRMQVERKFDPYAGEPWAIDNGAYRQWNEARKRAGLAEGQFIALGSPGVTYDRATFYKMYARALIAVRNGVTPPHFAVIPDMVGDAAGTLEAAADFLYSLNYDRSRIGADAAGEMEDADPFGFNYDLRHSSIPLYLPVQNGLTPELLERAEEDRAVMWDGERDRSFLDDIAGIFLGGDDAYKQEYGKAWAEWAHERGIRLHYGRAGTGRKLAHAYEIGADSVDSALPQRSFENWRAFINEYRRQEGLEPLTWGKEVEEADAIRAEQIDIVEEARAAADERRSRAANQWIERIDAATTIDELDAIAQQLDNDPVLVESKLGTVGLKFRAEVRARELRGETIGTTAAVDPITGQRVADPRYAQVRDALPGSLDKPNKREAWMEGGYAGFEGNVGLAYAWERWVTEKTWRWGNARRRMTERRKLAEGYREIFEQGYAHGLTLRQPGEAPKVTSGFGSRSPLVPTPEGEYAMDEFRARLDTDGRDPEKRAGLLRELVMDRRLTEIQKEILHTEMDRRAGEKKDDAARGPIHERMESATKDRAAADMLTKIAFARTDGGLAALNRSLNEAAEFLGPERVKALRDALGARLDAVSQERRDAANAPKPTPATAPETKPAEAKKPAKKKRLKKSDELVGEWALPRNSTSAIQDADALAAYFTPGEVVEAYGGQRDIVIAYEPATGSKGWHVVVQRAVQNESGAYEADPTEDQRVHYTVPNRRSFERMMRARGKWPAKVTPQVPTSVEGSTGYVLPSFVTAPHAGTSETAAPKDALSDLEAKLEAELRELLGGDGNGTVLNTGINPIAVYKLSLYGAIQVARGTRDFARWSRAMVSKFGESVRAYLEEVYAMALEIVDRGPPEITGLPGEAGDQFTTAARKIHEEAQLMAAFADMLGTETVAVDAAEAEIEGGQSTTEEVSDVPVAGDHPGGAEGGQPEADAGAEAGGRAGGVRGPAGGTGGIELHGTGAADQGGQSGAAVDVGDAGSTGNDNAGRGTGQSGAEDVGDLRGVPYRIEPGELDDLGGPKARARRNIQIINIIRQLDAEQRPATRDEQQILVKWVGWGGLADAFPTRDSRWSAGKRVTVESWKDDGWEAIGHELKEMLSPEEYATAEQSTQFAHYTSSTVIDAMYSMLRHMGVPDGAPIRALEPGAGIGHFIGHQPWSGNWTAVEMDHISAAILRALYPQANTVEAPFQDVILPDGHFDVVVGNPPFAKTKIRDHGRRTSFSLHDFFFVRAMDKLRPGGLLVFITSTGFMDKGKAQARIALGKQADLVAAFRLPGDAFKKNAATQVTTDIVILRKRMTGEDPAGESWMAVEKLDDGAGGEWWANEYYVRNPDHILGKIGADLLHPSRMGVSLPAGADFEAMLRVAGAKLPTGIFAMRSVADVDQGTAPPKESLSLTEVKLRRADGKGPLLWYRDGQYVVHGNAIMQISRGRLVPIGVARTGKNDGTFNRIQKLVALGEAARDVTELDAEAAPDAELKAAQKKLDALYDAFWDEYGPINRVTVNAKGTKTRPNTRQYKDPINGPLVMALESYNEKTGHARKESIFTKRRIAHRPVVDKVDTAWKGVILSLARHGRVDLALVQQLYGQSEDVIIDELTGRIFLDPTTGQWAIRDLYLSGDVKEKLAIARAHAAKDPRFEINVTELEAVQPADVGAEKILEMRSARPGATWITADFYAAFLDQVVGVRGVLVSNNAASGAWSVTTSRAYQWSRSAYMEWSAVDENGATLKSPEDLLRDLLAARQTKVRVDSGEVDDRGRPIMVVSPELSAIAEAKKEALAARFAEWLMAENDARTDNAIRLFNDAMNTHVETVWDGSHLRDNIPGLGRVFKGRELEVADHQLDVVWRFLATGNLLMAHEVGAGKTMAMIIMGMEAKRLGLANKPMYAVPNRHLEQFRREFLELYPSARILVATPDQFDGAARREFLARAATGDWDAVVIRQSSFGLIPISTRFEARILERVKAEFVEMYLAARANREDKNTVKRLQAAIDGFTQRIADLRARGAKRDDTITFDQLGVDLLFVDEAHEYKNLDLPNAVQGVTWKGSGHATDLYIKTRYLEEINPGRGIVFATATPVSNALSEMYVMQRYLMEPELFRLGYRNFNQWAADFVVAYYKDEMTATGAITPVFRARFYSSTMRMAQLFRSVADVKRSADLNLNVPPVIGGGPELVKVPGSPRLRRFMRALQRRWKTRPKGKPQPGEDGVLSIMNDGRFGAIDARMVGSRYARAAGHDNSTGWEHSKADYIARGVFAIWQQTAELRGTQLIFSDLGVPKDLRGANERALRRSLKHDNPDISDADLDLLVEAASGGDYDFYNDIKHRLIELGVPAAEIAFIQEADAKKQQALIDRVNEGDVRILIGSTPMMGQGINVQTRLVALHHADVPFKPAWIDQREGRIIRQGNHLHRDGLIPGVTIKRYILVGSYDAKGWQIIENKARFIEQGLTSTTGGPIEAMDAGVGVSPEEMAAIIKAEASDNPYAMAYVEAQQEVKQLEIARGAHEGKRRRARSDISRFREQLGDKRSRLVEIRRDASRVQDVSGDKFVVKIGDVMFTDRAEAGKALLEALRSVHEDVIPGSSSMQERVIGEFSGFPLRVHGNKFMRPEPLLSLKGQSDSYYGSPNYKGGNAEGIIKTLEGTLRKVAAAEEVVKGDIRRLEDDIARNDKVREQDFPQAEALAKAKASLGELETKMKQIDAERAEQFRSAAQLEAQRRGLGAEFVKGAMAQYEDQHGSHDAESLAGYEWAEEASLEDELPRPKLTPAEAKAASEFRAAAMAAHEAEGGRFSEVLYGEFHFAEGAMSAFLESDPLGSTKMRESPAYVAGKVWGEMELLRRANPEKAGEEDGEQGQDGGGVVLHSIGPQAVIDLTMSMAPAARSVGRGAAGTAELLARVAQWWNEDLISVVRKQGAGGAWFAKRGEQALARTKRVFGKLHPRMKRALLLVSGVNANGTPDMEAHRASEWLQTTRRDGASGFARAQDAIEGRMKRGAVPDRVKQWVKEQRRLQWRMGKMAQHAKVYGRRAKGLLQLVMDPATGGMTVRKFTPTKGGRVFLRMASPYLTDMMMNPRGPAWDLYISEIARLNNLPVPTVRKIIEPMTGKKYQRTHAEIPRVLKVHPTHLYVPDGRGGERVIPLLEVHPYRYTQASVTSFSHRIGFVARFGQSLTRHDPKAGKFDALESLRDQGIQRGVNGKDMDNMLRALAGIPLDESNVEVGTLAYEALTGTRQLMGMMRSSMLSRAWVPNLPEFMGNITTFGGVNRMLRAMISLGPRNFATTSFMVERLGLASADVANLTAHRDRWLETQTRRWGQGVLRLFPTKPVWMWQEKHGAVTGLLLARDIQSGRGTELSREFDRWTLISLLDYSAKEADRLMAGKGTNDEYIEVASRFASRSNTTKMTMAAESSAAANNRVYRDLMWFTAYPQMKARSFARVSRALYEAIIAAKANPSKQNLTRLGVAATKFAQYHVGTTASGATAYAIIAFLKGGPAGLAVVWRELEEDPLWFFAKAWGFAHLGPVITSLGRVYGRGDIESWWKFSAPITMFTELYNAMAGYGNYERYELPERMRRYASRGMPGPRAFWSLATSIGLTPTDGALNTAIDEYWLWRRSHLGDPGRYTAGRAETAEELEHLRFRREMLKAYKMMVRKDALAREEAIRAQLNRALDVEGKDLRSVAGSIRARKLLSRISEEQREAFAAYSPESYRRLEEHDLMLERWANPNPRRQPVRKPRPRVQEEQRF